MVLLCRSYIDWIAHTSCRSSELLDLLRTILDVGQQKLYSQTSWQLRRICEWPPFVFYSILEPLGNGRQLLG